MLQMYVKIVPNQLPEDILIRMGIIRFIPFHPYQIAYSSTPFPCLYALGSGTSFNRINIGILEAEPLADTPFTVSYGRCRLFAGFSGGGVVALFSDTASGQIRVFRWDPETNVWSEGTPHALNETSYGYIHHSCLDEVSGLMYVGVQSAKPGELYSYNADQDIWDVLTGEDLRGVDCVWDNKLFASVKFPVNVGATEGEEARVNVGDTIRCLDLPSMTWHDFEVRMPKPRCGRRYYTSRAWLMNIKSTLYCWITGGDNTMRGQQYEQRGMFFKYDTDKKVWLPIDIHPQVARYLAGQTPCYTFSDTHLYIGHQQVIGEYAWRYPQRIIEIPLTVLEEA